MKVEFVRIGEEASAVLSLNNIPHNVETGEVDFPDSVQIGSDQGETNQPSYYTYRVEKELFVYPLDTETLVVE